MDMFGWHWKNKEKSVCRCAWAMDTITCIQTLMPREKDLEDKRLYKDLNIQVIGIYGVYQYKFYS